MEKIAASFDVPVLINIVEGGSTPVLPPSVLEEMGFRIALYPGTGFLAAGHALREAYGALRRDGGSAAVADKLYPFGDFSRLMWFEAVWDFERRWPED
jgi:2-methylisocitrate lyase-like PEP mutase family enzyme